MKQKLIAVVISLALLLALMYVGCDMSVNDPIRNVPIFEPYISVQPASHSFKVGDAYGDAFPLKVEVWEWDGLDGSLAYQWYTFNTLQQYYTDSAEAIPGATGSTYTPSGAGFKTTAGSKNYYYVVVTNNNSDAIGGRTSADIKSDVAIVSFSDTDAPAFPEIVQNPLSASYVMGLSQAIAPLDVRATAPAATGGQTTALSYQWYSFDLSDGFNPDGTPKGVAISGTLQRTYLPDMAALRAGKNYYYVQVSNVRYNAGGDETGRAEQISMPATISMELGIEAAAPRINGQPRDLLYFTGTTLDQDSSKLSINAASIDGGTLSYQWYSVDNAAGENPVLIPDEDAAEFLPTISTAAAGTAYYHVAVKNTNPNVTGESEKTVISNVATVQVAASGTLAENLTVTVDPSQKYQYIRGYGGMEIAWANFFEATEEDMENMYNPEILGYNIMRIMLPVSNVNVEQGIEDLRTNHRPRYYENVKIVNKYNGYVLASPWTPPKEWKSNNSINGGGHLRHEYYKQYSNYLRSFARLMSAKGAPIYAISIQNEPNYVAGYDGCEWEPEEMRDFFKQVGRFTQGIRGYGGGKVTSTVLTMNGESANNPNINHAAIDDPQAFAAIDLFARHVYGSQTENLWTSRPQVQASGKEVWMTEHNINSASSTAFPNDYTWNYIWPFMNDVDLVMRISNENAFVWWASKRFYSYIGDGDSGAPPGNILPRGWGLAHYSKFTIDTTRIGTQITGTLGAAGPVVSATNVNYSVFSLDNVSARITAYQSQDGKEISLIMWTPTATSGENGNPLGNVKIQLPQGFIIRSATAMRSSTGLASASSPTANKANVASRMEPVTIASDRNSAYVAIPVSQIYSVKFISE